MLAERYHWPKSLVDEQDADYVDELAAFMEAHAKHAEIERKRQEREAKKRR